MEEQQYDFSSLFERSEGDYAGSLLERLFGGVIPYFQGTTDDLGAGNWLSTIFGLFNTAGLLAVLIVTSYTIYTVIMDTASDGKVFGQRTDTKYTIMRTMAGLIAFVPVSGGYSLAQVAMLFLVLQGSALGDVVWTRTADVALRGQPLLVQPAGQTVSNYAVQGQFARAYDALVLGHLCAINANSMASVLGGDRDPDLSSPIVAKSSGIVEVKNDAAWVGDGGISFSSGALQHAIRFEDTSQSYAGRDNFCGGVENSALIRNSVPGVVSFVDQVAGVRVRSQFENYVNTINTLSSDARNLAMQIYNGQRDVQAMRDAARAAIQKATANYASGASSNLAFSSEEADQLHKGLLTDASENGWTFAPAWQRGISMGASWYGSPDGDLRIQAYREANLVEFLSGQGHRTGFFGDSTTNAMLAKATDDFETWDMMSPYLASLADADSGSNGEEGSYSSLNRNSDDRVMGRMMNWVYQTMLQFFSPTNPGSDEAYGYVDPMVQVTQQGKVLMISGAAVSLGGAAASGVPSWVPVIGGMANAVSGWMIAAGTILFVLGFVIGTLVPMIPLVYFYSAVLSWVMLVVESMFAVPLAVLTLFAPAREGSLIGSWNRILLSIFGIFFRPFFTVVGLIFAMMVISFSLLYLYDLFYILMEFLVPGETIWNVFSMMGFLTMYVIVTTVTVLLGAQLISELGDGAMNWLGVTFGALSTRLNVGEAAVGATSAGSVAGQVGDTFGAAGNTLRGGSQKAIAGSARLISSRIGRIRGTGGS